MRIGVALILLLICFSTVAAFGKSDTLYNKDSRIKIEGLIGRSQQLMLKYPDSARKLAEAALMLSKKTGYKHGIGLSFNKIGVSYWVQSFLPVSQFYLNMSVPYLNGDSVALVNAYKDIARNYVDLKNYKTGLHYFMLGLKMAGSQPESKAELYTELTSLYSASGDYATGLKTTDTAFKYSRLTHRTDLEGILYSRRAQIFIQQKRFDLADKALDTAIAISYEVKNHRLRAVSFIDRARIDLQKNDLASAQALVNNSYLMADSLGSPDLKLRVLKVLIFIAEKHNDLQKANQLNRQIAELHERTAIVTNQKTLELIQDYFELNNKLNVIDQVNSTIESQHRTIALLITSLIVVLVFLLITFINYHQKTRLNARLKEQHEVLIDQKKLIEMQRTDLEDVNKLKDKLLAIIGHDLRTPIASMSSIADLFAMGYITDDEVSKLMSDLAPVVKGAELTLSNLMDFAASQMTGQTVMAANVNLFLIAVEMKKTFEHQLQSKNITFNNNCGFDANLWADANHVKIILRNLISNAVKFTNNGGQINISSSTDGDFMVICVKDTGVGLTHDQIAKLFNVNQHFSQKGTSGEKGTGLGLLLCKELVELNHGKIWVTGAPGEGCKFCFSLPMFAPNA